VLIAGPLAHLGRSSQIRSCRCLGSVWAPDPSTIDIATDRRNRYSNLTTNESSYQRPQPRRCERAVFHLGFSGLRSNTRTPAHGSVLFRCGDVHLPSEAELTCIQYALILLPGLIAGRLCDLGYFKRTLFISRSVTRGFVPQNHLTPNSKLVSFYS